VRAIVHRIGARLFIGFFLAAVPTLLATGMLLEREARRALEVELGRRAETLAISIGTSIPPETWQLLFALGPGEEESRIARHLRARLQEVERATGAQRLAVWRIDGSLVLDSRSQLTIGSRAPRADLLRDELQRVARGESASTPLFRSEQGRWVKLGLAPLRLSGGEADSASDSPAGGEARVGVLVAEAPAQSLGVVGSMRRMLATTAGLGLLLVAAVAFFFARALTGRIDRLVAAARRMEAGDLEPVIAGYGVDEIGQLAGALEAMRGAVKLREHHLRAMLGGVAHEIRNPLGGLVLNAEMLTRDAQLTPEARARAGRILTEAIHLEGVVTEFLAYARPERPVSGEVALDELAPECARAAQETLRWAGRVELRVAPVSASCDAGHLRQILLNLLLNGMQAAGAAGSVRVTLEREAGVPRIDVEDSGPGIAPGDRERIFEPFYSTRAQGAGLGLAIVKRLCELGALRITVDGSALGGARFTLRWPGTGGM
jgi:signal transduction histidine kinase